MTPPAPRPEASADPSSSASVVWIDSHCHLQFEERDGGPGDGIRRRESDTLAAEIVARAVEAGVERMVCIDTDLATSREAVRLAGEFPEVWATVGLHPHDASKLAEEWEGLV